MTLEEITEKYTNGNIIQAEVLLDMGFPWKEDIYLEFVENLSILKFIHSLDIPFSKDLFTYVVDNDRVSFETLKWLRSVGAPWGSDTFDKILYSENRHNPIEIIKWMIKEGCPRNTKCLEAFIYDWDTHTRDDFMRWLIAGCP